MLWKAFKYTEKSQKVIFEKNVSYNPFALSPRYLPMGHFLGRHVVQPDYKFKYQTICHILLKIKQRI